MGTFGGGVGGTEEGDVINLNAATPGHGSPPDGITSAGSAFRVALLPPEFSEDLFDAFDLRALLCRRMLFFLLESSSEDTS